MMQQEQTFVAVKATGSSFRACLEHMVAGTPAKPVRCASGRLAALAAWASACIWTHALPTQTTGYLCIRYCAQTMHRADAGMHTLVLFPRCTDTLAYFGHAPRLRYMWLAPRAELVATSTFADGGEAFCFNPDGDPKRPHQV